MKSPLKLLMLALFALVTTISSIAPATAQERVSTRRPPFMLNEYGKIVGLVTEQGNEIMLSSLGSGTLGTYSNISALQSAKPAASNTGALAYSVTDGPVYSDGTTWTPFVGAPVVSSSTVAVNTSTPGQVTLDVTSGSALNAAVSPATSWTGRGSCAPANDAQIKRVTSWGNGQTWMGPAAGFRIICDGANSQWRVAEQAVIHMNVAGIAGTATTAEQLFSSFRAPAGLLLAAREVAIYTAFGKSATNASAYALLRIGTTGTIASDNFYASISNGVWTSSNVSATMEQHFSPTSTTNLRTLGLPTRNTGWSHNGASDALPGDITVADMSSTDIYFSLTAALASASDIGNLRQFIMELKP